MAQITELQCYGWPGQRHSFAAKDPETGNKIVNPGGPVTGWAVHVCVIDGATSFLDIDGEEKATGDLVAGFINNQALGIGASPTPGAQLEYFDGEIAEIAFFNRAFHKSERQYIAEHLMRKYNIENS